MAFEPRRSDLPLQIAFPILLANLSGELLGGSERADRGHRAGHAGRAGHPRGRGQPDRHPSRRDRHRARAVDDRRLGGDLRRDRPAGHLHRHAGPRPGRLGRAVGVGRGCLAVGRAERVGRSVGGRVGAARRHSIRSRRPTSPSTCSTSTNRPSPPARRPASRRWARPPRPPAARPRTPRPVRRPATSCGCPSSCSCSWPCASSGRSTTVTGSSASGARSASRFGRQAAS